MAGHDGALILAAIAGNGGANRLAQRLRCPAQPPRPLSLASQRGDDAQSVEAGCDPPAVAIVPVQRQPFRVERGRLRVVAPVTGDPPEIGERDAGAIGVTRLLEPLQRLGEVRLRLVEVPMLSVDHDPQRVEHVADIEDRVVRRPAKRERLLLHRPRPIVLAPVLFGQSGGVQGEGKFRHIIESPEKRDRLGPQFRRALDRRPVPKSGIR